MGRSLTADSSGANSSAAVLDADYKCDTFCQLQEKTSTNPPEFNSDKLRPAMQNFCLRQAKVKFTQEERNPRQSKGKVRPKRGHCMLVLSKTDDVSYPSTSTTE
ncbi:hypothetical protein GRJ2_001183300 [Grus japonensis]|uniref:Uncharacterized protein n=1 Tax=Grus japonensis TaxID=30415 RepID=A0ABC9WNZ6_GRUJA